MQFWEVGGKRSALVPVVKDVVGIIFPRSQKSPLILWSFDQSPPCVSHVNSPRDGAEIGEPITSNFLGVARPKFLRTWAKQRSLNHPWSAQLHEGLRHTQDAEA